MQQAVHQLVIGGLTRLLTSPTARNLDLTRYSWPLLPYVGPSYESAPVKIVIVGKAPGGWGETKESSLADYDHPTKAQWDQNARLLLDFVGDVTKHYTGGRGYHSSFWHRTYGICASLLEGRERVDFTRDPERAHMTFHSIAWTNVFKIGTRGGNPDASMADLLLSQGPLLRDELALLRPDIAIFSTGHGYDVYLCQAGLTVSPVSTKLAAVDLPPAMVAIRAPHFQAQGQVDVNDLYLWITSSLKRCSPTFHRKAADVWQLKG